LGHACWFLHEFQDYRLCDTRDIRKAIRDCLTTQRLASRRPVLYARADIALHMQAHPIVKEEQFVEPEQFRFKDNGIFQTASCRASVSAGIHNNGRSRFGC